MPVKLKILQMMLMLLPNQNTQTLYYLMTFLTKVARRNSVNQMTASNLATCFGPNIIRKKDVKDRSGSITEKTSISPALLAATHASRGMQHSSSSQNVTLQAQPETSHHIKRRSIFSLGKGSSDKLASPNRSTEKLATNPTSPEKDAKALIATNIKIVDVITFMIEHNHEIWEIPESIRYKFQTEMNMVIKTNPEIEDLEDGGRRRSL